MQRAHIRLFVQYSLTPFDFRKTRFDIPLQACYTLYQQGDCTMTLDDILQDIYALEDELHTYERKYNVLSETFYEAYENGEEPLDDAWVRDWTAWASAYGLWLRRREQYRNIIARLRAESESITSLIARTARHESVLLPG
jgi:hypothetical protein